MIVNLNLKDKNVVVIGGGGEALKRINALLSEGCKITVASDAIDPKINSLAKDHRLEIKRRRIQDMRFLARYEPDLIITTTNDHKLNQKVISYAKRRNITVYSSDDPGSSDFANPAVIDIKGAIYIAVFTGGKSPAVAKKIKERIEKNVEKLVSVQDIGQVRIQRTARMLARENIPTQKDRKAFLTGIMSDKKIKQLIKDEMHEDAESRVATILEDWKWGRK